MKKNKIFKLFLAVIFIMVFALNVSSNNVLAAGNVGFSIVRDGTGKVTPGDNITVYVKLNANNVESFQGTLVYSKELTLKSYNWGENVRNGIKNFNPSDINSENAYKGNKILSFAVATQDRTISGENTILALTFDTSLCKSGSRYQIEWNTESSRMLGSRTYVYSGDRAIRLEQTQGITIETNGTAPTDDNNSSSNQNGTIENSNNTTNKNQSSTINDIEENGENNINNSAGSSRNNNSENVKKGGDSTTTVKNSTTGLEKQNQNKSSETKEVIPQLGGATIVYIIGFATCLLVILISIIQIKRMKKI